MESANLAPGLLLAMPQLADPNFSRSVVLMIEHSELLDSLEMSWHGDDAAVVWAGGPVSPSTGWVLHEPVNTVGQGTIAITSTISLSTSPEKLRTLAKEPPRNIRLLLGYSGWAAGQLAQEMARGAWLHTAATPSLVFETPPDLIWDTAMRTLGINPRDLFTGRGVN